MYRNRGVQNARDCTWRYWMPKQAPPPPPKPAAAAQMLEFNKGIPPDGLCLPKANLYLDIDWKVDEVWWKSWLKLTSRERESGVPSTSKATGFWFGKLLDIDIQTILRIRITSIYSPLWIHGAECIEGKCTFCILIAYYYYYNRLGSSWILSGNFQQTSASTFCISVYLTLSMRWSTKEACTISKFIQYPHPILTFQPFLMPKITFQDPVKTYLS